MEGAAVGMLEALVDPMRAEEELRALREQRWLLSDLIDDVSLTRQGLQLRLTAGSSRGSRAATAAWCSPSSNAYDRRAEEIIRRLGDVIELLQAALEAMHADIARLAANGLT